MRGDRVKTCKKTLRDYLYHEEDAGVIYCGDCLEILPLITEKVDLVLTDPPYNISKDYWDKIIGYKTWFVNVLQLIEPTIKDNGSFYWFHSEMLFISDMIQWIEQNSKWIFRQFIVWNKRYVGSKNKGFLDGYVEVKELRNYQQMAEYCLFYTFQDETGLSKIMGNCIYPIRDYIRSEIIRARGKISLKEINTILGTATNGGGVASACLSLDKTCPAMITEEHYLILREWLNHSKEYEYLRREYEDLRFTFNNQGTHHSIWNYEIEEKKGHVTPKPLPMIQN